MLIAFIGVSETYLCCKVIPVPQMTKECYSRFFISTIFTHLRKGVSFVLLSENWKLSIATQNRLAYSAIAQNKTLNSSLYAIYNKQEKNKLYYEY